MDRARSHVRIATGLLETSTDAAAVTVETMETVLAAVNRHDLDAIRTYVAEDVVMEMPRGPDPWAPRRRQGGGAGGTGLAFHGHSRISCRENRHWVCGNRGASEWLRSGTTTAGERTAVRGCDHREFRDGLITRKDSFWNIVG